MSILNNNRPFVRGGSDDVCHCIAPQFSINKIGVFTNKQPKKQKEPVSDVEQVIFSCKTTF